MKAVNTRHIDAPSDKERRILDIVLKQYNFNITNFTKIGSVYKLETPEGNICLKKIRHGRHKANNACVLAQELLNKGFCNVPRYYKTIGGKNRVRYKKLVFYATEWIDGEECNLNNIDEAIDCVKLLAQFHLANSNIDSKGFKTKNDLKNWPKIFKDKLQDIERYERIINNKRIKGEFDSSYYKCVEKMYHRGMVALNFLNTSDYYKLSKEANKNKTICHNNFYGQNIIKKENKYYIIDLDDIDINIYVNDLAELISRLMCKRNYNWDFSKAKILIEAYDSINKLSKSKLEIMLALIVFPDKFWKLGRKRYKKHKPWDEAKYMQKLTKILNCNEMEDKFLEDYLCYLEESFKDLTIKN